jgi:adenylate cyclase
MLDKFIGDAIMAGFGVPLPSDDDADRAIRTAISMITCLNEWNKKRASEGKDVLKIGIGLNTDEVVVGNIGSPKRMDYTMIGDGVNLAARLEAACKHYGTSILMSGRSLKRLRGTYRLREIDKVVVKGKTEAVAIYEVMDHHTTETYPDMMDALQCFREGLDWYRSRKWDNACKEFNAVLSFNPHDVPATIYVDRCQKLKETPPPGDWDGTWIMLEK